jgi:hypothetical protein
VVYALRLGVGLKFTSKKRKKLGFLKEQSCHYSVYVASIHLTQAAGLSFCLLLSAKHEEGSARLSEVRNDFEESLSCLNLASKLWKLFKALMTLAVNEMVNLISVDKSDVPEKVEQTVINFFT